MAAKRGDTKIKFVETRQRVLVYRYVLKANGYLGLQKRWEWRDK